MSRLECQVISHQVRRVRRRRCSSPGMARSGSIRDDLEDKPLEHWHPRGWLYNVLALMTTVLVPAAELGASTAEVSGTIDGLGYQPKQGMQTR